MSIPKETIWQNHFLKNTLLQLMTFLNIAMIFDPIQTEKSTTLINENPRNKPKLVKI